MGNKTCVICGGKVDMRPDGLDINVCFMCDRLGHAGVCARGGPVFAPQVAPKAKKQGGDR